MKRNKIVLVLLILSFALWISELYELGTDSELLSYILSPLQFIFMVAIYFIMKKENK